VTNPRAEMLERIRSNIARAGNHVTVVQGDESPRFAYTVGLTEAGHPEFLLAGANALTVDDVVRALNVAAEETRAGEIAVGSMLEVEGIGEFRVGSTHTSWRKETVLAALDYYSREDVDVLQLVPVGSIRTIDVPDASVPLDPGGEPVWRWMVEPWPFDVSPHSIAVTNLDALRGDPVTEATRWEETEWEIFAGVGPDTPEDEVRVVPLATLLGYDESLEPVTRLGVPGAIRRFPDGPWADWVVET
jgi:hypothetical protein